MNFNINDRMIYLVLTGSHAYGFARPESDVDTVGIAIPTSEYFYGFLNNFEQYGSKPKKKNSVQTPGNFPKDKMVGDRNIIEVIEEMVGRKIPKDERIDSTIFGLLKFMGLASNANPNILEILYAHEDDRIVETSFSDELIKNRDLFLSAKAKFTFSGYAFSQLKRIKGHRAYLLSPPTHKPTRVEFGLPDRTVMATMS